MFFLVIKIFQCRDLMKENNITIRSLNHDVVMVDGSVDDRQPTLSVSQNQ